MDLDPQEFAEAINRLLLAAARLAVATNRNPRRTKAPTAEKRRAVDALFLLVLGRKATEAEHASAGTEAIYHA